MKIQYASDLHLEFPRNKEFLKTNPLLPEGDILLLAGDVVPFAVMDKHKDFFSYVSDNFQTTYWVPGNHEYYYFDAATRSGKLLEKIRDNVFLINNTAVLHQNIKFLFSTLWSKINPANQWQVEKGMSDFQVIKYNGKRFSAENFNQLHDESIAFIANELQQKNAGITCMITHHVPTLLNYPKKYIGSEISDGFVVELFETIEPSGIDYWIYGHHHENTPDFKIGNTLMLTNQVGYVQYGENQLFKQNKCISI